MVSTFSLHAKSQTNKKLHVSIKKSHLFVFVLMSEPLAPLHHHCASALCSCWWCSCALTLTLTSVFMRKHNSHPISSQWPLLPGWSRWKVSAFRGGRSRRLVTTYLSTWYHLLCSSEGFFSRYTSWLNVQKPTLNAEKPRMREQDPTLRHTLNPL